MLGILRCGSERDAQMLSCFLNSSLGQAQIERSISGATGQTQLSTGDLMAIRVPAAAVLNAEAIAEQYTASLTSYEPLPRRIRREIARAAVLTSRVLADHAALGTDARSTLKQFDTDAPLLELLDSLRPEMF